MKPLPEEASHERSMSRGEHECDTSRLGTI